MPRSSPRLAEDIERSLRARENGEPRRFVGFDYMHVFAQGGIPMREVPQASWVVEDAEPTMAAVNCHCGHGARAAIGDYPAKCPGPGCPRSFFFDGTAVWALLSPLN